jgi:hypothetical protein
MCTRYPALTREQRFAYEFPAVPQEPSIWEPAGPGLAYYRFNYLAWSTRSAGYPEFFAPSRRPLWQA